MSVAKVLRVAEQKSEPSRYERIETSGNWKLKPDNTIVWEQTTTTMSFDLVLRDWCKTNEKVEELSPEQSPFKLAKSLDVSAILIREKDDDESPTGKTILTYERKFKVKVRDEAVNVWLTRQNGFVFVKDLMKMYTYRFELQTDPLVTCAKISEKRIDTETAKAIQTSYAFSKYEKIDNDTEIYGRFVKPS